MAEDRRLIEDFLPIGAISEEARIENAVTQARGYLSKALLSLLHRWWARRPLVACRAAVYAALVPAARFRPVNGPEEKRESLARANAARFLQDLCRRTVSRSELEAAAAHIREAHGGRAPRILDQFAGGGSIPLEAARLGCEVYALELNPVAHLVELATLVYPAKLGDRLVDEVRRWSRIVYERARADVGDLYPMLRDEGRDGSGRNQGSLLTGPAERSDGLVPVAYLWTRTVPCKHCGKPVALHRQTWLAKKPGKKAGRFVAVRPVPDEGNGRVRYELVESQAGSAEEAIASWGFDPTDLSKGGETECPFCRSAVPTEHVKACGKAGTMGTQLMAVVAVRKGARGKVYLPAGAIEGTMVDEEEVGRRLERLLSETGLTLPTEPIFSGDSRAFFSHLYGLTTFAEHFTSRQLLTLLTFAKHIRQAYREMLAESMDGELARAVTTYLAFMLGKVAERGSAVTIWDNTRQNAQAPIKEGKLPMTWDFPEPNPFGGSSGSWEQVRKDVLGALGSLVRDGFSPCGVQRGSALTLPYPDGLFDAVVTDPPYYDSVPYAYLADFFYVWLKRTVGELYPEHFAGTTSPVKAEAVMDPSRHGGKREAAKETYEAMMAQAFAEARRVLKPGGPLVCVYAHKTTAGWATLVDALRKSGFVVTEAWPVDTENPSRQRAKDSAALASSIFLVARRREETRTGGYEEEVRPELERIVRERVATLWEMGIGGADLVIAAVGAGLRAFTRFARVEYANGEEVPADRFLAEVEGVVLETLLERIFGVPRAGVAAVDGPSRFYVLWRYTYGAAALEGGEAIVFTYGQPVELDGPDGLTAGTRALVEKRKGKYRLRDYTERGPHERLGLPGSDGRASLIDVLHRTLWLLDHEPRGLPRFLDEAAPDIERLRLLAQTLAGPGLKGSADQSPVLVTTTGREQAVLGRLLANWRTVIERQAVPGQSRLFGAGSSA